MNALFTIVKLDYLKRTRSYAFLITLCASLAIAYTFVPEPNAGYSTIRVSDYVGVYNSAWFGYVTAIMTSIFLSLIGFYLVNSGIKSDIDSNVGQIIATTKIRNFTYLFVKAISNFLVLLTILVAVFCMSIILFFLYNDGFPFEFFQFIKPYLLITMPALFVIAVLAVVFEVFLGKYSVVQNIGFFIIFSMLMLFTPKTESQFSLDVFGSKIVMHQLEESVREITHSDKKTDLSIGYITKNGKEANKFQFNGVQFPTAFILSRFLWIAFGIMLILIISPFFHRFNIKEHSYAKKEIKGLEDIKIIQDINLSNFSDPKTNYSIFPLLKAEFLLLFRKGKNWLWIVNVLGIVLLATLPINFSHQMVLPILWFLQVHRLSDLTTKEVTNNVHYFAFTAFKPIRRLLFSQLISGIILMLLLALPLLIRFLVMANFTAVISVLLGGVFIVLFATALGILTKGKKLFEVLFFMITYANINGIIFSDYFGAFTHHPYYLIQLGLFILFLGAITILTRKAQLEK